MVFHNSNPPLFITEQKEDWSKKNREKETETHKIHNLRLLFAYYATMSSELILI